MPVCFIENSGSANVRAFGNIVASDIEGAFFFDVTNQLNLDLGDELDNVGGANSAFIVRLRTLINVTSWDEAIVKEYGGLPTLYKFGYYGFEIAGFQYQPRFISSRKGITSPAYIWIDGTEIPDLTDFVECGGAPSVATIRSVLSFGFGNVNEWASKALFLFEPSVVADLQLVYVAELINAFYPGMDIDAVWGAV